MKLPIRKQYLKELFTRKRRKKPLVLQLPITSRCNSRCVTCGVYHNQEKVDIDPEKLKEVLSDPFFAGVQTVGVNGGEFTLVKSFLDIIEAILTLPKISNIHIITNGLLPEKLFDLLLPTKELCERKNVRLHLCLSCDGVGKIHETTRGVPNCFIRTKQILDKMVCDKDQFCHEMSIGCTISRYNVEHIWQTYHFLSQYPFPVEYHLAVPNKRIGTFESSDYYVLNDEKSRLLAAEFFYILYVHATDEPSRFQNFTNYYFLKTKGKMRLSECEYRYRDVTIDEKMNLYLCATASECVGDLNVSNATNLCTEGALDDEAKKLYKNCCSNCIHYSYHKHTLKGRWIFVRDYVTRLYAYQLFELYTKKRTLGTIKEIAKVYYHIIRKSASYFRQL